MFIPKYTLRFFLRGSKKEGPSEAQVYLRVIIGRQKLDLTTGQKVPVKLWNEATELMEKAKTSASINKILQDYKSRVLETIATIITSRRELTIEVVKKVLQGETLERQYGLVEVAIQHNQEFQQMIGIRYSQGSYKNYKTTLAFLKEFIRLQYDKDDLNIDEADYRFCELFFLWLTTTKTCQNNGAAKHIQRLKKIGNYAVRMGFVKQSPFQKYSIPLKPSPREALTWEEIRSIEKLELQTPQLNLIRDIFLFQVFTGLCYADVKAFKPVNIIVGVDSRKWIKMERTKTRSSFTLPLLKQALAIIQRSGNSTEEDKPVFKVISNQKMNAHLKVIQELASISKTLHTHLPRHTFATTVMLQSGIPLETVSKMMGHSRITITQVYAKLGELRIAADLKDFKLPGDESV